MKQLENLLASKTFEHSGPVSDDEIERHERNLSLKFGPSYRLFLSKFGYLAVGPNELYGICGSNAAIPSAIHATVSARRNPAFPRNVLVVAEDGRGRMFCVNAADKIVICDRHTCTQTGQSFEEFAIEWLSQ